MTHNNSSNAHRKSLAFEKLNDRRMLTTFALANNPVLEKLDAEVFIDDQGQGTLDIDLDARKFATSDTFFVDEQSNGDGSASNPFADIRDALVHIESLGLTSANIEVAAGNYTWGDVIREDTGSTFNANLNVVGAGSNLTRIHQQPNERAAAAYDVPGKSLYLEGISFIGDDSALGDVIEARRGKNLTLVDTQLRDSAEGDGLFVINFQTVVVVDTVATGNGADGFSYTRGSGSTIGAMAVIESNVRSDANGTNGQSNSQGSSTHRDVEIVRVNSLYRNNPTNVEDTGLTSWNVDVTTRNSTVSQLGGNVNFRVRGDKTEVTDGLAWLITGDYGDGGVISAWGTRANDAAQTPVFGNIKVSSLIDLSQYPSTTLTESNGAVFNFTPDDSQLVIVDDPPPVDPPVGPPADPPTEPPVDPPTEPPVDPPTEPPVEPPTEPPVEPPVEPPTTSGDDLATIFYKSRELDLETDEIEFQIQVSNDSGADRNFEDAELRYYFTPDGLDPVFNVKSSNAPIAVSYVPSGSYVSIRVTDDFVVPNGKRWKLRLEIEDEDGEDFDQSNDPSFKETGVELEPTEAIDLLFADDTPPVEPPAEPPVVDPPAEPPTVDPPAEPPTVDLPAEPSTATPTSGDVRLVYLNKEINPITEVIEAQVEIYNETEVDQNFQGLEVRYYIDADGLSPEVSLTRTNAPDVEIEANYNEAGYASFNVTEDLIVRRGKRLKLRFEISNEEGDDFDQTNDPSYGTPTGRIRYDNIAVLLDGELLWGDLP